MKKILFISLAVFALVLSGCAPKAKSVSGTDSAASGGAGSGGLDAFGSLSSLAGCSPDLAKYLSMTNGAPTVHFDFNAGTPPAGLQKCLSAIATQIKTQVDSGVKVSVEGHCDEWGTDEYNQALGLRRAASVKGALTRLGVKSKGISTKSYGESQPACTTSSGDKGECDFKNRRAEIRVGL